MNHWSIIKKREKLCNYVVFCGFGAANFAESGLPNVNTITQREFLDHIEDDDFLLKYGNPVAVLVEDGSVLMCMAIEYYERMTGRKVEIPEELSSQEENK